MPNILQKEIKVGSSLHYFLKLTKVMFIMETKFLTSKHPTWYISKLMTQIQIKNFLPLIKQIYFSPISHNDMNIKY